MKAQILLLLLLTQLPFVAHAQTQWVLQPYLQYFGHEREKALGSRVKGFVGSQPNNPYNVAVAESHQFIDTPKLRFYVINSPQDTTPRWVISGADVEHGDFNGDGLTDFAVWKSVSRSIAYDTVLVYLGNVAGIDTIPALKIAAEKERSEFGARMCVGDLNNDRIDDLVITAELYQKDPFQNNEGKVYVHLGGPALRAAPDFTITGSHPGARLGSRCAIGDFNEDGFNDLAIRGYDESNQAASFGYLNIYLGSTKLDSVADLTGPKMGPVSLSNNGLAVFDANGDLRADFLWTFVDNLGNRAIYLNYGGYDFESRFKAGPDFIIPAPPGSDFGNEIIGADMNGDSENDLIIAGQFTGQGNGIVFVYTGGKALDDRFDAARGQSREGAFGASVDRFGDINKDGFDDIIIGAPNQPWTRYEGYFGIFLGDSRIPTNVQIQAVEKIPADFNLSLGYPNPFNQKTVFEYTLKREARIEIRIFNLLGKEVKTLLDAQRAAGQYGVPWDGRDEMEKIVPNGIYFVRMKALALGGQEVVFEQTQKFTVVK